MGVTFGLTDKEREKINLLFDNVSFVTANDNKVAVELKGIGDFEIPWEEHNSKPSYISGLPYAYQYFKENGKGLDFDDLINIDTSQPYANFYKSLPAIARHGLTKILENKKLDVVYLGLKGEKYAGDNDEPLLILYESSKAFGNKSADELIKIKKQFDNSLLERGFIKEFYDFFGKGYLQSNQSLKMEFQKQLFKSIKEDSFTTDIGYEHFDLSSGFRGNEYIKLLQIIDKYKVHPVKFSP